MKFWKLFLGLKQAKKTSNGRSKNRLFRKYKRIYKAKNGRRLVQRFIYLFFKQIMIDPIFRLFFTSFCVCNAPKPDESWYNLTFPKVG